MRKDPNTKPHRMICNMLSQLLRLSEQQRKEAFQDLEPAAHGISATWPCGFTPVGLWMMVSKIGVFLQESVTGKQHLHQFAT